MHLTDTEKPAWHSFITWIQSLSVCFLQRLCPSWELMQRAYMMGTQWCYDIDLTKKKISAYQQSKRSTPLHLLNTFITQCKRASAPSCGACWEPQMAVGMVTGKKRRPRKRKTYGMRTHSSRIHPLLIHVSCLTEWINETEDGTMAYHCTLSMCRRLP